MPISEFHVAFCGIATVAATLGYACARRAALSLVSPPESSSKADVEAGPPEERSLKRKLDDSDDDEVGTEEHTRPIKRNRTPPSADENEDSIQEWELIVPPPSYEQAIGLRQPEEPAPSQHGVASVREPTPPVHSPPATSSQSDEKGQEAARCSTPQPPQLDPSPNQPEAPPTLPVTPPKPAIPVTPNAFSAFSTSTSPFASYSNPSGASPFALSCKTVQTTPAWRRDNESSSDVFGQTSPANALAPSPNDALSSATTKSSPLSQIRVSSDVKSSSCLTGEENETVEAELKGVKLFTKRGRKEFTDGMYGHIKILAQRSSPQKISNPDPQETEAETNSRIRLLFRRDPLGQVSLNVGLNPTVRCHFDTAENILRVILMEQVTTDVNNSKEDVVIYALKSGRAGKADFLSFAKTLCDHEALKSTLVTSSAAPGDATAS